MNKVISAGGILVRNNPEKQILLTIFKHIQGLGFAKGHVEKGETIQEAAIREVEEETGVKNLKVIKKLGIINRLSTELTGEIVEKDIHIFLMDSDSKDISNTSEESCDWFTIEEAINKMAVKEDKEFLIKIKDQI